MTFRRNRKERGRGASTPASAPRSLRVMYFVPATAHFAGIERVVHEVASGLARTEAPPLDVHVVYGRHYDEPVLASTAYTMHEIDAARLRRLLVAGRRVIAQVEPDVVVVPQVEAATILWFASRGLRVRAFIAHLHGNPNIERRGGSVTTKLAFHVFTTIVSRRLAGVIAVSPSLAASAQKWLGSSVEVAFAPNPVRTIPLSPTPAPRRDFQLLCVGRLSRQKGQDVLLRALALARPDLPPTRLTLLGTGPEEPALRGLADELGIEDLVDFAGYATDPTLAYASADCFVLASRWEGFGLVLVEALQAGLPIVAADCDFGPADIVQDPRAGELVPPEDAPALAAALVRAAHRPSSESDRQFRARMADPYIHSAAIAAHRELLLRIGGRAETPSGEVA